MIIESLEKKLDGKIVMPESGSYDLERKVFNGYIDKYPSSIIKCASTSDIRKSLDFALEHDIEFTIRGGGHSVAGHSTIDDGLIIDCGLLRNVNVDLSKKIAVVEPGATWCDFDKATQAKELASTGGIISNTGVAGLTLGGGLGWLMGKCGLACDNLIGGEILCADGQLKKFGKDYDEDLFWALRGGGGNFGVVTSFIYKLHPLDKVLCGTFIYEFEHAMDVLLGYSQLIENVPREATFDCVLQTHNQFGKSVVIDFCYSGSFKNASQVDIYLSKLPGLLNRNIKFWDYCQWQKVLDDDLRRGRRSYWKSHYVDDFSFRFAQTLVDAFECVPSPYTMLTFDHLHGAVSEVDISETAFGNRNVKHVFLANTNWESKLDDEKNINWAKALFSSIGSTNGGYINYLDRDDADRIPKAFSGDIYSKLKSIKTKYDPENKFKATWNVKP